MFPTKNLINDLNWDGEKPLETKLLFDDSPYTTVVVKDDNTPILFRTLELNQKQIQAKAQKEREKSKPVQTKTKSVAIIQKSIYSLSTNDLKAQLKALGLSTTGTREQMLARFEKLVKN